MENRELIAKEFSKSWYEVYEKGKRKKYFFNVYYCPETKQIQIGEKPSYEELFGDAQDVYASWKSLTRQMFWNFGITPIFDLMEKICYEQSDIDQMKIELGKMDWKKIIKDNKKTWIRFSGGSEQ